MNFSATVRLANRGLVAVRHRALVKPCSPLATQVHARYNSTNTNGTNGTTNGAEKKEENTVEQKQAKEIEQLKKDLEESKKETLIAYADRQTSIRIAKEDVRKAKEYGIQKFALGLFDVSDVLERAIESVKPESLENNPELKTFFEGVQMTEKLLLKAYEQSEIRRFNPLGQKFDPNLHLALSELVDATKEPGTVSYVMKNGYQMKDRLLRAANVVVAKADPNAPPKDAEAKPASA